MPATVSQVNAAIATALSAISGLQVFDYQPDTVYPPIAYPAVNSIEYHKAMQGGNIVYDMTVTIVCGRVNERVAQDQMDGYASYGGATSVRAALEADPSLGGVVDTSIVSRSASVGSMMQGEQNFLTLDFSLTVYA